MANDPKKPAPGLPWDDADESALNSLLEGILPEQKQPPLPTEDDSTSIGAFFDDLEKGQPAPLARREEDSTAMFSAPSVMNKALPPEEDDSTAISQMPVFLPPSLAGGLPLPSTLHKPPVKLPLPSSLMQRQQEAPRAIPEAAATPPYGSSQTKIPLPNNIMGESKPKPVEPDAEPTPTMRYEPAGKRPPEASPLPSPQRPARTEFQEMTINAPLPVALQRSTPKDEIAEELFAKPQTKHPTGGFPVVPASKPALPSAAKPSAPPKPSTLMPKPGDAPTSSGASAVLARLRANAKQATPAPVEVKSAKVETKPPTSVAAVPEVKPASIEVKEEAPAPIEATQSTASAQEIAPAQPEVKPEPVSVEPGPIASAEVSPKIEEAPAPLPIEAKPVEAQPFIQPIEAAPASLEETVLEPEEIQPEPPRPLINRPSASGSGSFKPAPEPPKPPPPSGVFRVAAPPRVSESGQDIPAPKAPTRPPPIPTAPPPIPRTPTRTAIPILVQPQETSGGGLQEDILDILRDEVPESIRSKAWQPQPTSIKKAPAPHSNFDVLPPDSDVTEPPTTPMLLPFALSYQDAAKQDLELIEAEFLREHEPRRRSALAFEAGRIQDELLGDASAARVWFEKSLRANPQNKTAARCLRMTAERTGELKIALEAIQRELSLSAMPAEQSNLQLDAAELWRRLGNEPELRAALKRAVEIAPEDARAQYANVLQNRSLKQWDAYTQSAQKFAARGDIGALAPALFWDVGTIEEFIRRDEKRAEVAYRYAENVGEAAAPTARERLALKREDFVSAANLAPKETLAASCLRVGHLRDEISEALQRLAQLPASITSTLAQDPKRYETLAEQLSTPAAQSAALAVHSAIQKRPELLIKAQGLTHETAPLSLSMAANSTPFDAISFLLPLFPQLRGFLAEHYARDSAEALSSYLSAWKQESDPLAAHSALRLVAVQKNHALIADMPALSYPDDERPLRLLEGFDTFTRRGNTTVIELLAPHVEKHPGLLAFLTAQRPVAERTRPYLELAQQLTHAPLKAALYLRVAKQLEEDPHRALDALLRALELQPLHRPTREAALSLASRNHDNALYRSLRAAELSLSQENPALSASISYELGALREEEGDSEAAMTHYLTAVGFQSQHAPALLALARLAAQKRDFAAQAKHLSALLPLIEDPSLKASTLLMLGELFAWPLFEHEKAQQSWKEAWGTAPIAARPAARALEILCGKQGDLQTLGMIYQSALTTQPPEKRPEYLIRLATLANEIGSFEVAGRFFYDTLQQNPSHPTALLGLSFILLNAGRTEDVQRIYQQAAGISQSPAQKAAFELNALAVFPSTEQAQAFGRLFAAAPAMPLTQQSVISLARQSQDWATEASVYQQLANITEEPTERAFWKNRQGQALLRQNNPEALIAFTEALMLQPGSLAALRGQELSARQTQDTRLECSALEQLGDVLVDPKEASRALLKAADIATRLEPEGERARQSLWKALKRDPKNLEAFTKLRATLSPTSLKDALTIKQVIEQRLGAATGEERRLLLGELASLCKERLNEPQGARMALRELVQPDSTPYAKLVDLAELEEQAKEYEAAANLYVRILRLSTTTPKQRRDAYWHSGLIYDEHLPDPKKALSCFQHVMSLGGMGEKEAALRLSRLQIKLNERSQASDLILRVATAEPEPKARLAFLLQSTRLWLEFDDKAQAIACCQRALTIDDHHIETIELLADLYQKKNDDRARSIHLTRAVQSFRESIRKDLSALDSYHALVRIFRLLNDQTRATAAAVLYCSFGGEQADIRALAQTAESWPGISPEKLVDPKAKEKLQHPSALSGFRVLLSWLGDVPKRAYPSDVSKHGAGVHDRINSGPALTLFQTIGKAFGVASVAVYTQKLSPFTFVTEPGNPTAFVMGAEIMALPPGAELRFVAARATYLAGQGPIFAHSLKPQELRDILIGSALALAVPTKLQKTPKAEEISKIAAPVLARKDANTASSLILESLRNGDFQQAEFAQGVKHEANRAAVLVTGSIRASLEALARIHGVKLPRPGEKPGPVIAQSTEFNELVQFILSDNFLLLRK